MNLKLLLLVAVIVSWRSQAAIEVFVTTADGQPLPNAVVTLHGQGLTPPAPLDLQKIVQQNKTFLPDVLLIPVGTEVSFPNEDTVRHHVYSFSAVKTFEIKLYVGTPAAPVKFEQPGIAVLGCNIHDEMIAWVVVVDTPFYAKTNQQGLVNFADVPQGEYRLQIWHKAMMTEQAMQQQLINVSSESKHFKVEINQPLELF